MKDAERLKERLLSRSVRMPNGCLEWQGARDSKGYGRIGIGKNKIWLTHRLSLFLHLDMDEFSLCVLHKCDNPPCLEPEHLFLGTKAQNTEDMLNKGRNANGNTKKTHCVRGHNLKDAYISGRGKRLCKPCNLQAAKEYQRAKRLENSSRPKKSGSSS